MKKIGIIFDVDGTLWDSSQEVAESWNEVFLRHPELDKHVSGADIKAVMGKPMDEIARIFFPVFSEAERVSILRECEENELDYLKAHPPKAFLGVKETFEALSGEYPLFIVSNAQSGYIETLLAVTGLGRFVSDFINYGDNEKPKSDNIRWIAQRNGLDRYFYMGDIQADCDATIAAGGEFIHAAYGFGSIDHEVPRAGDIRELPALMAQLAPAP
ncbi:MAG: HAD family hydrolase [Lachnospiraceae bacterium]|nr:HAD family hydrolase [Lachnospiraceae bacterium]